MADFPFFRRATRSEFEKNGPSTKRANKRGGYDEGRALDRYVGSVLWVARHCGVIGRSYLGYLVRQLALELVGRGLEQRALTLLFLARALSPRDPRVLQNLGVLLCDSGKVREAMVHLRRATEVDPTYARAFQSLARCARKAGFVELAQWAQEEFCKLAASEACESRGGRDGR